MAHIDLKKYFVEKEHETGRPRYDREKLLKIVLFAFMEFGYCSLRLIGYKRLRRRGIEGVIMELGQISCGFNLYKYHLKKIAMQRAA